MVEEVEDGDGEGGEVEEEFRNFFCFHDGDKEREESQEDEGDGGDDEVGVGALLDAGLSADGGCCEHRSPVSVSKGSKLLSSF